MVRVAPEHRHEPVSYGSEKNDGDERLHLRLRHVYADSSHIEPPTSESERSHCIDKRCDHAAVETLKEEVAKKARSLVARLDRSCGPAVRDSFPKESEHTCSRLTGGYCGAGVQTRGCERGQLLAGQVRGTDASPLTLVSLHLHLGPYPSWFGVQHPELRE